MSHITSGKAITEDDVMADIVAHCQKQESTQVNSKKKQKCVDKTNNCKKAKSCVEKNVKVSVSKKTKTNKSVAEHCYIR